ncbi:riboflavin synthase [Shouchella patagoniensis]|uniref:riboflavin synthase n=1 Tax=Shouchella patagoniensis TaxID=228576 RepID=UPI0009957BF1|nr:riboflavin synthase [Shouchella patagoniensis]
MFTGIIEEKGIVSSIKQQGQSLILAVKAEKVLRDVSLGDSIAVNGVCLTVTTFTKHLFTADVMPETFQATTLKQLVNGSPVNLERAMPATGRFGGHIVSGHIDGIGVIKKRETAHNAISFEIGTSDDLLRYIVPKGSIAIDGTSLTVFDVSRDRFTISIIPHTLEETIFGVKQPGDSVNLECDVIGKYVEKMLTVNNSKSTNLAQLLQENGF